MNNFSPFTIRRTWPLWPRSCGQWTTFVPRIRWPIIRPPAMTRTPPTKTTMKRWTRRQVKSRHLARRTPKPCRSRTTRRRTGHKHAACPSRMTWALVLPCSSSKLSNGETESVKTMIVHDEGESEAGTTRCKDSTLVVRQVPPQEGGKSSAIHLQHTFCFDHHGVCVLLITPVFFHFVCWSFSVPAYLAAVATVEAIWDV